MIVPDASVIVALLLRTPEAFRVDARLLRAGQTLHAPALLDLEVVQVLRRYVRLGDVSLDRGDGALRLLQRLPITRYMHEAFLGRIWALRENLTAYDAAYVALAEGLGATLVTLDGALARAPGLRARVEVL